MASVVIVGAGPGGAVLAYLLARRGIETTLVERHDDFAREFRGEVLLPSGLEPFEQMGLWPSLEKVPQVDLDLGHFYVLGKHVLTVAFDEAGFGRFGPRWMSQPGLLEMLVAEAGAHPSFRLVRGRAARELVEEGGRIRGVRIRTDEGDEEIRGDLVVGADGRASMVRRQAGLKVHTDPTAMDVVWLKLPPDFAPGEPPRLRAFAGDGHLLVVAPVYDGNLQLGWVIPKGTYGEIREMGMPECIDAMARHAGPEFGEHLRRHRGDSLSPFLLSTVSDRVESWTKPGLLVIGDAAHTMSPVGAQGLNVAIRDAVVAANHLVPVLLEGADPARVDAAARAVEAERAHEVAVTQRAQRLAPYVVFRNGWANKAFYAAVKALSGSGPRKPNRTAARGFFRFASGVDPVKLAV